MPRAVKQKEHKHPSGPVRRISDIIVGIRHRRDLGDIAALAADIGEVGLLHPVVVHPDGRLIAGERRLAACKLLGWQDIPVTVVELADIVRGEFAENAMRKDFLPSEIDAIRRALEPIEKAAARERTQVGRPPGGKFPRGQTGKTRDKIGSFAGISGRTVEKIAEVVRAAEAEPERFGRLLEDMDRTRRVNGVFNRLRVMRQAALIRAEPPPLPGNGPYRVIVCDPPWPHEVRKDDPSQRGKTPFPQMSIEQICECPVASIAAPDCILWLWTTNHQLVTGDASRVLAAWGFAGKTILTWAKHRMGNGDWLRGQTEHVLLAVRGKPMVTLTNQTTLLLAPVRAHSQKPAEFYGLVESLCPAPRYAELFARPRPHGPNWDLHGDEVLDVVAA
jgi:N6-adenosine-specific RNA methylase IME4